MLRQLEKFRENCWNLKLCFDKQLAAFEVLKINIKTGKEGKEEKLAGSCPLTMLRFTFDCGDI